MVCREVACVGSHSLSKEEGSLHLTAHVLLQLPNASKHSMEKPVRELMGYSLAPPPFLHDP